MIRHSPLGVEIEKAQQLPVRRRAANRNKGREGDEGDEREVR